MWDLPGPGIETTSPVSPSTAGILYHWATREAPGVLSHRDYIFKQSCWLLCGEWTVEGRAQKHWDCDNDGSYIYEFFLCARNFSKYFTAINAFNPQNTLRSCVSFCCLHFIEEETEAHRYKERNISERWSDVFSSAAQLCPTLCNPIDCSTKGLPVHNQLLEFAQTHVHRVGDAISSSVILLSSCLQSFPVSESFPTSQSSYQVAKVLELQHQSFRTDFLYNWLIVNLN